MYIFQRRVVNRQATVVANTKEGGKETSGRHGKHQHRATDLDRQV